jgi:hypothetical protein
VWPTATVQYFCADRFTLSHLDVLTCITSHEDFPTCTPSQEDFPKVSQKRLYCILYTVPRRLSHMHTVLRRLSSFTLSQEDFPTYYTLSQEDFLHSHCPKNNFPYTVQTVSPTYTLSHEQFRSEKRVFGDKSFGDWSFGDRAFGYLTVYQEHIYPNAARRLFHLSKEDFPTF